VFAAMHHPMAHGLDFPDGTERSAGPRIRQPLKQMIDGGRVVSKRCDASARFGRAGLEGENRFTADAFDLTARQPLVRRGGDPLGIGANQLELEGGRPDVENEYVHAAREASGVRGRSA
jgi:hypothetical protein